jgi:hypothetical protein
MTTKLTWRGPSEVPPSDGWYRVKREGDQKVRAFGNGHWWIPLVDGWLSADDVYEWALPRILPMDKAREIFPGNRMERGQQTGRRLGAIAV